ncbi:SnodProt1 [Laetiporus sulphureus 93-53]|uniref:SnodProt1 n=1 Tax=Laetiporus sulphureus 93-53 TaxID=1314785 RepID=A0A165FVI2_9APHY|nr:SnodProt1 [Laetiporus sulphureus 93-53]KZT09464.1 SnodProt1 [Laetiporus sulphureus 93-53]
MRSTLAVIHLFVLAFAQFSEPVSFDGIYSNASTPMSRLACSDSLNPLGFTTLSSLPSFPYIGGASFVAANGSGSCGTCWELFYFGRNGSGSSNGTTRSISVLAIDYAKDGFNIAQEAMDALTGGQARSLGIVNVTAVEVDDSACGL